MVSAVSVLDDVYPASTLTEASLLSGSSARDRAPDAGGGLLRDMGAFGILALKDLGSILQGSRDSRPQVIAALREIYDGSWTRRLGTDGGRTLSWAGKVGLVAAATGAIESHHTVWASMGERFIFFRLPQIDPVEQAKQALAQAGRGSEMRAELAESVRSLFGAPLAEPRSLSPEEEEWLVNLATLVVQCRTAVEREGYSRDIEVVHEPEAPARLIIVLERLLAGLDAVGLDRLGARSLTMKAGMDSIPGLRRAVLELLGSNMELPIGIIIEQVGKPASTTRRAVEDLHALGVVDRARGPSGADMWRLTSWAQERFDARVPDVSSLTELRVIPQDLL
jgi:hypothetical protein